jgi:DNA-binding NarL/FixJ family response regulator
MIVDNHPLMREGLAAVVSREPDLEVCCQFNNAAEGLAHLDKQRPDLLVTSLALPGRGGIELIKDVTTLYAGVPVLVISRHDELMHAERVLRSGARGYLMQEASVEDVLKAIRTVLSGKIFASERMASKLLNLYSNAQKQTPGSAMEKLSDREFQILEMIGCGKNSKEIAAEFHLSVRTVDVHRAHIKAKLNLPDMASLLRYAVCWVETEKTPSQ